MKPLHFFITVALFLSLACGTVNTATYPDAIYENTAVSPEVSTEVNAVEMVVIATTLNIRAEPSEKSVADPLGLKQGDKVTVYLTCTGGEMKDWLAIDRDCTRWVKAEWLAGVEGNEKWTR